MPLTIGIDYGGVCSISSDTYEDTASIEEAGINVDKCLDTLRELKSIGHRLVLISFCGSRRAQVTKKYLDDMYENPFSMCYFVKNRKFKKDVCALECVDVMIDDRLDILETIKPAKTIHFSGHPSDAFCNFTPDYFADNWTDVRNIIDGISPLKLQPVMFDCKKNCYH